MKQEQVVEGHVYCVLGDVWSSMSLQPPHLNCEENYYQAKLLTPQIPQSIYRCVEESKPRKRSAFHEYGKERNGKKESAFRLGNRADSPSSCQTKDTSHKVPWIDSHNEATTPNDSGGDGHGEFLPILDDRVLQNLRKEIEIESKEAVCVLALKKKISRLFDGADILQKMRGESKRIRRKRGRPPRRKCDVMMKEGGDDSSTVEPSLKIKLPRAKVEDNHSLSVAPSVLGQRLHTRSQSWSDGNFALRKAPPVLRQQLRKPVYFSEIADSDEDQQSHLVPLKDEELALQLHVNLNAPRLRKRSRWISTVSPTTSEQ